MTRVELNIADDLAQDAREAGLLVPERIEAMLRDELRRSAGQRLLADMKRAHAATGRAMPMTEVNTLVKSVRRERNRADMASR